MARNAAVEPGQPQLTDEPLPPRQALTLAQQLLQADLPFHAHEVLEAAWKAAPAAERDLWQGLAQLAVGLTHARRGNAPGAAALLRRGAARLHGYQASAPHGIDVTGLVRSSRNLADRIDAAGLAGLEPGELVMTLQAPVSEAGLG